jgi:hypothetical protein
MAGFYEFLDAKMVNAGVFGGHPHRVLPNRPGGLMWWVKASKRT